MASKCRFINCISVVYGSSYVESPNPVGNDNYFNGKATTDQDIEYIYCRFIGGVSNVCVQQQCSAIYRSCIFINNGETNSGCRNVAISGNAQFYNCIFNSYSQIINRTSTVGNIFLENCIFNTTGATYSSNPVSFINGQESGTLTLQNCTINGTGRVKARNIRFLNCVFNNNPDSTNYSTEQGQAYVTTDNEFVNCIFSADLGISDGANSKIYILGCSFNSLIGTSQDAKICVANCTYKGTLSLSDNATTIRIINNTQIPTFNS